MLPTYGMFSCARARCQSKLCCIRLRVSALSRDPYWEALWVTSRQVEVEGAILQLVVLALRCLSIRVHLSGKFV